MCEPDDGLDAWVEKWRKARKKHKCFACGETIRKGDLYHYSSGVWYGSGQSFKHCARCWSIFIAISAESDGPIDLSLNCGESWENTFGDLPDEVAALAFLTPEEGQAHARDLIDKERRLIQREMMHREIKP